MTTTRDDRIKELFQAALERPPSERSPFLGGACGADDELREAVEALLLALDDAAGFLEPHAERGLRHERAGSRIGHYELVAHLGEGGFGDVWRARQSAPVEREVALKIVKLGMDTRAVIERFEAERQALARMSHPGIAKVHDAGATETGRPYFVMELVEGVPLTDYCARHDLEARARLSLFVQVCAAVQHAHHKGVVHRDLKPGNVLVRELDGRPQAVVIDFGIAKALDQETTAHTWFTARGELLGTPAYMSPEQAARGGEDVDTRADVYSLGALLYELLTGAKPFEVRELLSRGYDELLRHIQEVDPPRPSSRAQRLERDLDWIVMRALEKDPRRRYSTASNMAADVERFLSSEPIEARPPSALYRAGKLARRHRSLAALAALFLVLLLAVGGWALRSGQRANESLRVAQLEALRAEQEREQVLRLADIQRIDELEQRAAQLWPAEPAQVDAMERWLAEADALLEQGQLHRAELAALHERQRLDPARFEDPADRWRLDMLEQLVDGLDAFEGEGAGLRAQVRERVERARGLAALTLEGEGAQAWSEAIAAIGDANRTPAYGGLALEADVGLLPLGADPESGLWEFALLASGAPPQRNDQGRLWIEPQSALVLVLLPGGRFAMGAQSDDPRAPGYDAHARPEEGPVREIELEPFFLSKFELTESQWLRLLTLTRSVASTLPQTGVSAEDARSALARVGLELPSEAQWEYAARAGTTTPWSSGSLAESVEGAVDWPDAAHRSPQGPAPVGSFPANPFGLHEVHGNVWEWTLPLLGPGVEEWTGSPHMDYSGPQVLRGGAWDSPPLDARSAARSPRSANERSRSLGVRPMRPLRR